ncbi:MAG: pyridoxamine 5'-phosphate oxidase family protein [Clostridiaceae bacterium]|nr:pyridoxamine 5'-phosphate oxidase family protein [Clostridiaceae bacterium]
MGQIRAGTVGKGYMMNDEYNTTELNDSEDAVAEEIDDREAMIDGANAEQEAMIAQEVVEQERAHTEETTEPEAITEAREPSLSPEQEKVIQQEKMGGIESVKKILDKARVAFLTTVSGKQLLSRPMYMQKREFDGTLWFFAKSDSPKVEDIRRDSRVNVLFAEKDYVSLSGRAEIVENDLKKKMYWGKTLEKYFETDYNDPDIVLIKIDALSAQFWEKPGSLDSLFNRVDPISEGEGITVEF